MSLQFPESIIAHCMIVNGMHLSDMRSRYLRQIIYVKGRVLNSWKKTSWPLLFRNSFLSLCFPAVFSYEWCMTKSERESKRWERLKSEHLILSKHRPPPLCETHKHSNIQYIHRQTHNHAYMQCPVWSGIAQSSHRAQGRRTRTFPSSC